MGHVFYDIFSIIIVSFTRLKFYLRHDSQKCGLQNGSFFYDIGVLLLGDRFTSLHPIKFYFMHFSLFSCIKIWTIFFLFGFSFLCK